MIAPFERSFTLLGVAINLEVKQWLSGGVFWVWRQTCRSIAEVRTLLQPLGINDTRSGSYEMDHGGDGDVSQSFRSSDMLFPTFLWGSSCLDVASPVMPACSSVAQIFWTRPCSLQDRALAWSILKKSAFYVDFRSKKS